MVSYIGRRPHASYKVVCIDYNGCDGKYENYCDEQFESYADAQEFVNMMNKRFDGYMYPRYKVEA